ncbi:MAG: signal recognition particle-docking protein FtsY [Candidatus Fimenecus sp.]
MGIFSKINFGLTKTRNKMAGAIDDLFGDVEEITDDLYAELEEILVMSDVGVPTAVEITERLKKAVSEKHLRGAEAVKEEIKEIVAELLDGGEDMGLVTVPSVVLVIGVNGVGKTTTIGKLAAMYKKEGKRVILGAADTFRAAAIDQLDIWAKRSDVEIIKHSEGADPAAVVFDTVSAAKARDCDIVIIDTAGRLHNKKNLMDELAKIYRVIDRELPYSDREVLLVLDATTGQNAVNQAREFKNVADITGIVLTKLDGTARGGVVLAIKNELGIPVKFVGVGEQIDDLQPFKPRAFADGLFQKMDYAEEEEASDEESNETDVETDGQDLPSAGYIPATRDISENESLSGETDAAASEEESAPATSRADEAGVSELEQSAGEVTEEESAEPKKKEKKRFGFFNRHA